MPRKDAPQTAFRDGRIVVEDQLEVFHPHRFLQEVRNDRLQDGTQRKVWQLPPDRYGLETRILVEGDLAVEFSLNGLDQGLDISLRTEFPPLKAQSQFHQRILFQFGLDGLEICVLTVPRLDTRNQALCSDHCAEQISKKKECFDRTDEICAQSI